MSDVTIVFDSPADVWRITRGDVSAEVSAEEMTDEYYRWRHAGEQGDWRQHAEAFLRQRLEAEEAKRTAATNP